MDKFKNNSNPTPALVVKLVLVLVFLLTAAFVSGVVIGKNGRRNIDRTSSDEEGINEKLSNCIFNSDELREKYLKLRDAAREKGLVDENDVVNSKVVCKPETKPVEKPVEPEPAPVETSPETSPAGKPDEPESVETSPETSQKEPSEPEKPKPVETKPEEKPVEKPADKKVETSPETSQKEPAKPEKTEKPDKNKTIDEILTEKKAEPAKEKGQKCRYSIQIFAANTKEQADAAAKKLKSLKPRIVSGGDKGKTWYKLRTGCFDSVEAAEAQLPEVKKSEKSAYIVSE